MSGQRDEVRSALPAPSRFGSVVSASRVAFLLRREREGKGFQGLPVRFKGFFTTAVVRSFLVL